MCVPYIDVRQFVAFLDSLYAAKHAVERFVESMPIGTVLLERERRIRDYMGVRTRMQTLYAHLARCSL